LAYKSDFTVLYKNQLTTNRLLVINLELIFQTKIPEIQTKKKPEIQTKKE
jgi:hypothetical protein